MKKIILILSVLMPLFAAAQISFDFENGSASGWICSVPGRWAADNLSPLNGSYSLHHTFDNNEAATDVALFAITGLCAGCSDATWHFTIRYGADPSSSNKWLFLLMTDSGPNDIAEGMINNGYAVGVNFTGYDDTLRLVHISDSKAASVVTTGINWQNDIGISNAADITVTRTPSGEWTLEVTWGGEQGVWSGKATDIFVAKHSGIAYAYTSTRDRLLWLDDVSLTAVFIPDTLPPEVVAIVSLAPDVLEVHFNEEPLDESILPGKISLMTGQHIINAEKTDPNIVRIFLETALSVKNKYSLVFSSLCDQAGNCAENVTGDFTSVYAVTGDIVITEIMADPSPPVELPEDEYLELTNIGGDSLAMTGWILINENDTAILPDLWLKQGEAIILCSPSDTVKFSSFGKTAGIVSFPSLNDSGETISIRDRLNNLIHAVSYSPGFYKDELRSDGGWSMEMTDTGNPFNEPDTWQASLDPSGGSPGRANSQIVSAPDNRCPEFIAAYPVSDYKVRLMFDESIMPTLSGNCWLIDDRECASAQSDDFADRALIINLKDKLESGRVHLIRIPPGAVDFAGNSICVSSVRFGLPEAPERGDLLFNELLFDPLPPCTDFIELYNNSDKVIDLSQLFFSALTGESREKSLIAPVNVPRQLLPDNYIALTSEKENVASYYSCSAKDNIFKIASLPSMPDDKGALSLYNKKMDLIDLVEYNSTMHMPFLSGIEGISLEKVSPDLPSEYFFNWHSASEGCNWGSPGNKNSVLISDVMSVSGVTLSADRISPDGDGFEDVLSVTVVPGGIDNVVSVTIFNERGYSVRRLVERYFAGESAIFIWDGTTDDGNIMPAGLYMILTESFNTRGQSRRWKNVCAVLYR